jgi:class 3 adenylate cyclase
MEKIIKSEILTVMFTDIVGYTSKTNRLSREKFNKLQDIFDEMSFPIFEKYNGNVIKKIGDAFLVTFMSPTNALLCGIELQSVFNNYNKKNKSQEPLMIKVAIHTGEVIPRGNDVYGEAVNIASRVEKIAIPGKVMFTGATYLLINKNEIPCFHMGLRRAKGIRQPIRVFRVRERYDEILKKRVIRRKKFRKVKNKFLSFVSGIIIIAIILVISFILLNYLFSFL